MTIGLSLFLLSGLYYIRTIGVYVLFPYVAYTLVSKDEFKDSKRWPAFTSGFPLIVLMRKYLQVEIVSPLPDELVSMEKKPNAQFMFSVFPHGVNSEYRICMDGMLDQVLPNVGGKVRVLVATVLFRIPYVREVALWTGCVDARRKVAEGVIARGRSILVVPGGEAEQIRTTRGREIVYLKNRKGFIKLAMQKGVPVVPVYVFGASDMYLTSHAFFGPRHWLMKTFGICIPLAIGKFGSPFCPLPVKNTIVFGKPLVFERKDKDDIVSLAELDAAHGLFCRSLRELFDEHKARVGYGDRELEML